MEKKAFSATVFGRVQMVGFRYGAVQRAKTLPVYGWVKNNPDGSVGVYAEGYQDKLELLAKWLERGPVTAEVSRVDLKWHPFSGRYKSFTVTY